MQAEVKEIPCDCPDTFKKHIFNRSLGQAYLILPVALYFNGANLILAADCSACSYNNFHHSILKNRVMIIGCLSLTEMNLLRKKLTDLWKQLKKSKRGLHYSLLQFPLKVKL